MTNPVFARVMAIEEKAYESGYDLIFAQSSMFRNGRSRSSGICVTPREGLFITPVYHGTQRPIYEELVQRGSRRYSPPRSLFAKSSSTSRPTTSPPARR
jgi:hypothetical protein